MSEEENNKKKPFTPQLPEGLEDNNNLGDALQPELVTLADGTQILKDHVEEDDSDANVKEEISDKDLKKLLLFTTGKKNITSKELDELRDNEEELERLVRVSIVKARNFNYNPKKKFDDVYRKKRLRKNRMTKASRRANR